MGKLHRYTRKPIDVMIPETQLKNNANTFFVELAGGIFHVEKDREGRYDYYANAQEVIRALSNDERVLVKSLNGDLFSNTDFLEDIKKGRI
ncbi:hypothetical protein X915_gp167 [Bacillus phage vB_BanS-Tsamsa]|uniref:Uncharacterized protein n=1 Tax=Bacillus phage vB_BanS-Tsamsa TaxID=1308863 RepID=U5J9J3_9CAUD|nr:hypothetical protein X915_gp167 [Bacillus phage vB_BanS-Tsamsa]AGI11893.1 hypothetical protein [Bacillus phage vB_BanS-Tsamsa]